MIEFQYFDGCPNADQTLSNLKALIADGELNDTDLKVVKVDDIVDARGLHFQGSPSVLLDGIDIYTDSEPKGYNYSCRLYFINDKNTGVLPKDYIKYKINRIHNLRK